MARWLRLLCVGVSVAVCGAAAPPAGALIQRGHVAGAAFGVGGEAQPEGQLLDPGPLAASAVGTAAGDVYVLDRGHSRIAQYGPKGEFISTWGYGVADGQKEYETCTEHCQVGQAGTKKYQFGPGAKAIAVDNCTNRHGEPCSETEDPSVGDVYVLTPALKKGEEWAAVDKFSPNGTPIERITEVKWALEGAGEELEAAEDAHGLAVGPNGTVWLYYEETLYGLSDVKISAAPKPVISRELTFSLIGEPAPGLAVGPNGKFYLGEVGYSGSGAAPPVVFSQWELINGESEPELEEALGGSGAEPAVAAAVNPHSVNANLVDEAGDLYLANVSEAGSTPTSSVTARTATGTPIQSFTAPGLLRAAGIAINPMNGTVYVSDATANDVQTFALEEPGPPSIDELSVQSVTAEAAQLSAKINPSGTPGTTYEFQYGPASCAQTPGCAAVKGTLGGQQFGEETAVAQLRHGSAAPLEPATTYHYRVLAANIHGAAQSIEGTFTTPSAVGAFIADERGWEMVSPPDKQGANVLAMIEESGLIQAAPNGNALAYLANGPFAEPEGNRSIEVTQLLAHRDPHGGWASKDLVPPYSSGEGIHVQQPREYDYFSSDLSLALLTPFPGGGNRAEPPLAPHVSEKTMYVRANRPIQPETPSEQQIYEQAVANGTTMHNPGYVALVDETNVLPGMEFGHEGTLRFLAATSDLSHAIIESRVPLTAGSSTASNLYEWTPGRLEPINILPAEEGGEAVAGAQLGHQGTGWNVRHALSDSGTRSVWSLNGHMYLRDTAAKPAQTLRLDKAQGVPEPSTGNAVFQAASAEDNRVFFTDTEPLTPQSSHNEKPDLYVCEITENPATHDLRCTLTDLTPPFKEESANVQGVAIGASEDGTVIYFVADGALTTQPNASGEQATPGLCGVEPYARSETKTSCDLYSAQLGENKKWELTFIAGLSSDDERDWRGKFASGVPGELTSRVSPDGRYLAFMSDQRLTGYDNDATAPAAHDSPAEEVFLYDNHSQQTLCASCEPSNARPTAVLDPPRGQEPGATGNGESLLVDQSGAWSDRWLAASLPEWTGFVGHNYQALYQSRYLSNSGRLYFDSPEALVPHDTNGKEDVYEYEPLGVPRGQHACTANNANYDARAGGCVALISAGAAHSESAFLDASESGGEAPNGETLQQGGGDVFFVTADKLVSADSDDAFDAYDAHECTGERPCEIEEPVSVTACNSSETCRPPAGGSSASGGSPPTATPSQGNIGQQGVLPNRASKPKPKPLTRAQKLAKALKVCRTKYRHARHKRLACENTARHRYGPLKKKSKPSSHHAPSSASNGAHR